MSTSITKRTERYKVFHRKGLLIITSACVLIFIGFLLMSGPGSTEQAFNPDIFSVRRIVVAPLLCLLGYLLIIIGVLKKD